MMRAYMYAYGYGSARMAKELVARAGINASPCVGCHTCTVSCPKGFAVRERIADVARLQSMPEEFLSGVEFA
jgi:predicted aldo/keto reductase-like oxidoreductase